MTKTRDSKECNELVWIKLIWVHYCALTKKCDVDEKKIIRKRFIGIVHTRKLVHWYERCLNLKYTLETTQVPHNLYSKTLKTLMTFYWKPVLCSWLQHTDTSCLCHHSIHLTLSLQWEISSTRSVVYLCTAHWFVTLWLMKRPFDRTLLTSRDTPFEGYETLYSNGWWKTDKQKTCTNTTKRKNNNNERGKFMKIYH